MFRLALRTLAWVGARGSSWRWRSEKHSDTAPVGRRVHRVQFFGSDESDGFCCEPWKAHDAHRTSGAVEARAHRGALSTVHGGAHRWARGVAHPAWQHDAQRTANGARAQCAGRARIRQQRAAVQHQSDRCGRRRRQRGEPYGGHRYYGRGVLGDQHRRAGVEPLGRQPHPQHRQQADARAGCWRQPGDRPQGRRGVLRPDRRDGARRRPGVRDRGHGRRHWIGRGAGGGRDRPRAGLPDGGRGHQAVRLRGPQTHVAGAGGHRGAARERRHVDRGEQRQAAADRAG
eukprot:ctg_683.g253